ncbi:MAG TPA: enoyl-CoA hydratase/isomerase family protein [Candidatus Polarisedimenticolia bacterium]|nr:enoyl-CoA hydratase/isomerase family protein [Candidatus Polarisedimenticolia bacterium]
MKADETTTRVRVETLETGAVRRFVLTGSKGNIIDTAMNRALIEAFREAARARDLKAILLEGDGSHFSYGASIQEHLPDRVGPMLRGFHDLFRAMIAGALPVLAVVRGRCLGGGLELAAFCNRVFAAPDALLGQPEILLGVFAPVASMFLRERVGRGAAEDLCLSGRTIGAAEAQRIGLVDAIADDPTGAALAYAREHLLPRSAASLRRAVRAVRHDLGARFEADIAAQERLYLGDLMKTADAVEGIRSFLEKRRPDWKNA